MRIWPKIPFLLVFLLAVAGSPRPAVAHDGGCGWCQPVKDEPKFECDPQNESEDSCEGTFLGLWCTGDCTQASLPSQFAPDGSLLGLSATTDRVAIGEDLRLFGHELAPGIRVLRAACNDAITARTFTPRAAQEVRERAATLVL